MSAAAVWPRSAATRSLGVRLLTQSGVGTATADVPADLLPADVLYLRLRTSAPNSAFQVNDVEFSGDLAGKPPEGVGRTEFAEIASDRRRFDRVERDCFGRLEWLDPADALPDHDGEPQLRPFCRRCFSWQIAQIEARRRTAEPCGGPVRAPVAGDSARAWSPAGRTRVFGRADVDAARPVRRSVDASRRRPRGLDGNRAADAAGLLSGGLRPADRGRRRATTDVWWCEATWKVAAERPVAARPSRRPRRCPPPATTARRCRWCVRPTKALRQLTAAAEALWRPGRGDDPGRKRPSAARLLSPVHTPTDETGVRDDWPDALPPLDKPLDLPAGKNQPLWVLVHVPKDARPGDYAGTLDAEGRRLVGRRAVAAARVELRPAGAEPHRDRPGECRRATSSATTI